MHASGPSDLQSCLVFTTIASQADPSSLTGGNLDSCSTHLEVTVLGAQVALRCQHQLDIRLHTQLSSCVFSDPGGNAVPEDQQGLCSSEAELGPCADLPAE